MFHHLVLKAQNKIFFTKVGALTLKIVNSHLRSELSSRYWKKWVRCIGCIVLFIKSLRWGSPGNPSLLETKELLFIGLVPWLVLLGGLATRNFKAHMGGSDALSIGSVNSSLKTLHPHPYPHPLLVGFISIKPPISLFSPCSGCRLCW